MYMCIWFEGRGDYKYSKEFYREGCLKESRKSVGKARK